LHVKDVQWQQALGLLATLKADLISVVITYATANSACAMDEERPPALGLLAMKTAR
jgi:hypothetical protein